MHSLWTWLTCLTPEDFEHIVLGIASIVGAAWVLIRLLHERTWQSALAIEIESSSIPVQQQTLTFIEVRPRNEGKVRLRAKARRTKNKFAFEDDEKSKDVGEKNLHSASLRIKKLTGLPSGDAWIDWFNGQRAESLPEIDLLNEYENIETHLPDFWMEPGETYKLGVPLCLSDGVYLVKVTFVGNHRGDDEFWSRIAVIRVPAPE